MSLNFYNASANTVFVTVVDYDTSCGDANQNFSKHGWYAVASGATMTPKTPTDRLQAGAEGHQRSRQGRSDRRIRPSF